MRTKKNVPLYEILAYIASLWIAAEVGYRVMPPLLGFSTSYNVDPLPNALYYLFWVLVSLSVFRPLFTHIRFDKKMWHYAAACLGFATLLVVSLKILSTQSLFTANPSPAIDFLVATPWYFLPKSVEILVQQTLIAALILALFRHYRDLRAVIVGYAIIFGGAHILFFAFGTTLNSYAFAMTIGSILSALIFPYVILRVPSGFVYSYMIHVTYYLVFALLTRTLLGG